MYLPPEVLQRRGYWYLGHPYSHGAPYMREDRWKKGLHVNGLLMTAGVHVYNPIHATHELALVHQLPYEHDWWIEFNRHFIDGSVGMLILALNGWEQSRGLAQEIDYCRVKGKQMWLLSEHLTSCTCYI